MIHGTWGHLLSGVYLSMCISPMCISPMLTKQEAACYVVGGWVGWESACGSPLGPAIWVLCTLLCVHSYQHMSVPCMVHIKATKGICLGLMR